VRDGIRSAALHNAHDIAEGGLAVAIAECCVAGGIGARVQLPDGFELFGESPGTGYVVSGPPEAVAQIGKVIGSVGGSELQIEGVLSIAVSELAAVRDHGLAKFV
jgi:phosphoribosylformylglycinamidine synthase